jgi:endonuclease/exonuclease/phosphatase family metal-dependent hydrolase
VVTWTGQDSVMRILPKSVLVAALGLLMLTPAVTAAATSEPAHRPDRPLRVLTYNIHHGQGIDGVLDLERVATVIDESGADVIGLQEVDKFWSERSNWEDQPAWLARRLDMHVTYAANLDLPPLNPGEPRRQYGTAILSRFPIKDVQNTLLAMYPGQEQRGLLEATIKVRGTSVRFANTHLTHNNNAERLEQVKQVIDLLGTSRQSTVLVGDLNAPPSAPEITTLAEHWRDTWTEVGIGPGYTLEADNPTARIDYVLHSEGVHALSAEVLNTNASDHLPVLAQLSLP